jgi:hypothetical protein
VEDEKEKKELEDIISRNAELKVRIEENIRKQPKKENGDD